MNRQITDMETWLLDNEDRIFSYQVYKRIFTPYESDKKFIDESIFENGIYLSYGIIEEAIDLGDDWLLGIRECLQIDNMDNKDNDYDYSEIVNYYKLSEIRLSYDKTIN